MQTQPTTNSRIQPAPCRGARRLLAAVLGLSLAISLGGIAATRIRHPDKTGHARMWMQALHLTAPALQPAGSPGRHPETVHPAVALGFAPGLEYLP